ncbi:MAG: hypothetical protein NTY61_00225 [Candidatus Parcubacteria bacterium]|nr:hypothetical protein [Candidatus Parcubacteria bacterium]
MLLAGAHINARDKHALRLAIWDRYTPRALFLLEHGARIPRKDLVGDELKWIMRVRKTAGGLLREWRDG